jgi:formylglycine-generating enzyme required for sulfatase activity
MPSEAEWEYACRAGTETPFHFGPTIAPQLANYCGLGGAVCEGTETISLTYNNVDYHSGGYAGGPVSVDFRNGTTAARSFPPNRFGLYQMHGNVWEHCRDNGPVGYRHMPEDGSAYLGSEEGHVLRGGAWSHNPAICRSAYRDGMRPTSTGWNGRVGLRVACDLA